MVIIIIIIIVYGDTLRFFVTCWGKRAKKREKRGLKRFSVKIRTEEKRF